MPADVRSVWQQMEPTALEHSGGADTGHIAVHCDALRTPTVSINQLLAVRSYISLVPVSERLMEARTLSSVKYLLLISFTPHLWLMSCQKNISRVHRKSMRTHALYSTFRILQVLNLLLLFVTLRAKYSHMRKNMAKWGIPEKSIKNAAQRR